MSSRDAWTKGEDGEAGPRAPRVSKATCGRIYICSPGKFWASQKRGLNFVRRRQTALPSSRIRSPQRCFCLSVREPRKKNRSLGCKERRSLFAYSPKTIKESTAFYVLSSKNLKYFLTIIYYKFITLPFLYNFQTIRY